MSHDKGQKARLKVSETWKLIKDLHAEIDYALVRKAKELKERTGIFVVAHTYQRLEVKELADVIGDSFTLASSARTLPTGKRVLHCSVEFMAETTKLLRPDLDVIVPTHHGGCGLADYITGEQIREWRVLESARLSVSQDELPVVLYINSYADAKTEADVICTSSNALKVVESLPHENVLFAPDRNLCYSIMGMTSKNLIPWEGTCPIHVEFSREMLESTLEKVEHESQGRVGVMIHPECNPEVIDFVRNELDCERAILSTGGMLSYAKSHQEIDAWVVGTEIGLIESLRMQNPTKIFVPVYEHKGCDLNCVCPYMKSIDIEGIVAVLEAILAGDQNALLKSAKEIKVSEDYIPRARRAIERMVEIGRGDGTIGGVKLRANPRRI